jgi:hypothetical protein
MLVTKHSDLIMILPSLVYVFISISDTLSC